MGSVTDINAQKPHVSGKAKCLHCNHKWVAVIPAGGVDIECPSCSLFKGALIGLTAPNKSWECSCGNDLFFISPDCAICAKCGTEQEF